MPKKKRAKKKKRRGEDTETSESSQQMADEALGASLNRALTPPTPIFSDRNSDSPLEKFLEAPPQAELEQILGFPLDEDRLKAFLEEQRAIRENANGDEKSESLPEKLACCFMDVHKALASKDGAASKPPPEKSQTELPADTQALEDSQVPEALACPEPEPKPPLPASMPPPGTAATPQKPKSAPIVISPDSVETRSDLMGMC